MHSQKAFSLYYSWYAHFKNRKIAVVCVCVWVSDFLFLQNRFGKNRQVYTTYSHSSSSSVVSPTIVEIVIVLKFGWVLKNRYGSLKIVFFRCTRLPKRKLYQSKKKQTILWQNGVDSCSLYRAPYVFCRCRHITETKEPITCFSIRPTDFITGKS